MEIILDLYDAEMAHAFANALKEAGYTESEYAVREEGSMFSLMNPIQSNLIQELPCKHFFHKKQSALV